jgi:hypothetical protein
LTGCTRTSDGQQGGKNIEVYGKAVVQHESNSMSQGKAEEWVKRFKDSEKGVTDDGSSRKPPTVNT